MKAEIRLGCCACDAQHDGITEAELGELLTAGWQNVERVRSYEDAIRPVEPGDSTRSVLDWETHVGDCPDCANDD